ncbi:MAG TPA: phenylalanine--tRNA ligase subunit beta, partial [Burkholderiales bacterium]|nr:phenylalanine--tRNA ligase subunit beta [Burkholderiales bacterium]
MKLSENWLKTLVDPGISRDELAHLLTMSGIEVEAIEPVAPPFEKVVVGKVLSVEKHPDADRLNVCRVDAGAGEPLQIVCGAPNVFEGAVVACALAGAVLPGISIREAKVRGVMSCGMLCSAKELGIESDSEGLLILPADADTGLNFRQYFELDDYVFDLKLTPNRADCLSALGIAREISAMTGARLDVPEIAAVGEECDHALAIELAAPSACPLYLGRVVKGVDISARTPKWMERRLERSGIRTRNIVVDVTNYVMLELGQPMHAFDLAEINGGIRVRMAEEGEKLVLLDGQEVSLRADTLVIADHSRALAIAGVMGGEHSGVSDKTRDLFLESAFFDNIAIAGKARSYGLHTDSSHRFERGVDSQLARKAMERATALLLEIVGGEAGPIIEVSSEADLPNVAPITLR